MGVDGGDVAIATGDLDRTAAGTGEVAECAAGLRTWLLSEAGRHDEAIATSRALPLDRHGHRARGLAGALSSTGRIAEAVAVLEEAAADTDHVRVDLARLLVLDGRPEEAVALHRRPRVEQDEPRPAHDLW